jgi:hypothetical protein
MLKFLKVFEILMKKIRIHLLQKAFIKNVDIIKTGLQGKGGIDFMKSFWKSQKFETKIVPLRHCKDAARTPLGPLLGRPKYAARTPLRTPRGRREDAVRTPRGRCKDAARTLQGRRKDAARTPQGRRKDAARTPQGHCEDSNVIFA